VLRRVLGLPDNTAAITDEVLRAVGKRDPRALIAAVNDERLAFLRGLKTWQVFGAGWGRRVAQVRAAALHMADTKAKTPTAAATAGATAAAGVAAAQHAHVAGARPATVAAIIIFTIMLALGGWFAWRWHQRRRQSARN
jgi:lysozyme family protein